MVTERPGRAANDLHRQRTGRTHRCSCTLSPALSAPRLYTADTRMLTAHTQHTTPHAPCTHTHRRSAATLFRAPWRCNAVRLRGLPPPTHVQGGRPPQEAELERVRERRALEAARKEHLRAETDTGPDRDGTDQRTLSRPGHRHACVSDGAVTNAESSATYLPRWRRRA